MNHNNLFQILFLEKESMRGISDKNHEISALLYFWVHVGRFQTVFERAWSLFLLLAIGH